MNLNDFGWNSHFQKHSDEYRAGFEDRAVMPARVLFQSRGMYRLISEAGELWAEMGGALRHEALNSVNLPACGDWVLADDPKGWDRTVVRFLLPRRTAFFRKQAGTSLGPQVIAANVDTVCLVSGLDSDFNPRRIERYLAIAWESGARPVVVLNKTDACIDVHVRLEEAVSLVSGVPVVAVSAMDGSGLKEILRYAGRGETIAFLGSSGVGKSSIVNRLLGRSAQQIRETDLHTGRGMHTTAARQLFLLPAGGLVMDTPGMRELQIWSADMGLDATFEDIKTLAEGCRFGDCTHQTEPGCRVRDLVERGELDSGRLANYFKLSREAEYVELKSVHSASWVEKERWRKIAKAAKKHKNRFE